MTQARYSNNFHKSRLFMQCTDYEIYPKIKERDGERERRGVERLRERDSEKETERSQIMISIDIYTINIMKYDYLSDIKSSILYWYKFTK